MRDARPATGGQAGDLADACRRLAEAGVNIEFLAPSDFTVRRTTLVLGVQDVEVARKVLGS